jgi:cytochrome c oxidase subunit IV
MARWIVAGLLVLNAVLGIGVYMHLGAEQSAFAQIGGVGRDYVSVAGYLNNDSVVYVLEPSSGRLVAIATNMANRRLSVLARRNITEDIRRLR